MLPAAGDVLCPDRGDVAGEPPPAAIRSPKLPSRNIFAVKFPTECGRRSGAVSGGGGAVRVSVAAVRSACTSPRMRGAMPLVLRHSDRLPGRRRSSCERVSRQERREEGDASQRAVTSRSAVRTTADAGSCW